MKLTEAMKKYEEHLIFRGMSPNTINGYLKELEYLRRYLEDDLGEGVGVEEISLDDLESFILSKKARGIVPTSINRFISIVRGFYSYLEDRFEIDHNPSKKLISYRIVNKPRRDVLSEEEVLVLKDRIDSDLVATIAFTIANTGLRVSEIINLKLDHVDLERRVILVLAGKGGKDRLVPINAALDRELNYYLNHIRGDLDSNFFFATQKTGTISRQWINFKIKEAVRELKWDKDITAHNLRHSFASNLVKRDANIVSVQKLLGHSDLTTTSIYLHQSIDDLKRAVAILDDEDFKRTRITKEMMEDNNLLKIFRESFTRNNLRISEDTYMELKALSDLRGMTVDTFAEKVLLEYLESLL